MSSTESVRASATDSPVRISTPRALGDHLGPGVPGTDHDEGAPGDALVGIGGHGGQLELPGDVIA